MVMKDFYRKDGTKIRFSTETPEIGSIYRSNGPLPGVPSYRGIDLKGVLVEPAVIVNQTKTEPGYEKTPERVHEWEIFGDCMLLIDGFFVAQAPAKHDSGKKFTQTERLKFCRAIVWQLMNDEGSLKDQLALLSVTQLPEPVIIAAPEVIAVIPVELPEVLNAYTPEGITGYPVVKDNRDYGLNRVEMVDLIEMNNTAGEIEEGYDYAEYDNVMTEFNTPAVSQMYDLVYPAAHPVIIRQWNHGRITITEEVRV